VTPSPPQRDAPPPPPPSASMMDSPAFGGGLLFVDPSAPTQTGIQQDVPGTVASAVPVTAHRLSASAGLQQALVNAVAPVITA